MPKKYHPYRPLSIEEEPESEKISEELEDLYSYDEDIDEKDVK